MKNNKNYFNQQLAEHPKKQAFSPPASNQLPAALKEKT